MIKLRSKFHELTEKAGLKAGDNAIQVISYLPGYFCYVPESARERTTGLLINPFQKFVVKYEDISNVVQNKSYQEGSIAVEGHFKRELRDGGYDLTLVPYDEFPPEQPAALNSYQTVEFLKRLKASKKKDFILKYIADNKIESDFFVKRILGYVKDLDLPHKVMQELMRLQDQFSLKEVRSFVFDDGQEKGRKDSLRKAGY